MLTTLWIIRRICFLCEPKKNKGEEYCKSFYSLGYFKFIAVQLFLQNVLKMFFLDSAVNDFLVMAFIRTCIQ